MRTSRRKVPALLLLVLAALLQAGVGSAGAETVALPNGATPYGALSSTACPAAGDCVAVGVYEDTAGNRHGVIDTENGGVWSTAEPNLSGLNPAANLDSSLSEVACTSTGNCVAAGTYLSTTGNAVLIDTEAGGSWTTSTVSLPGASTGSADPNVTGISCPTAGDCVAVGTFVTGSGLHQGLLLVESGGVWSALTAPLPGIFPIGFDAHTSLNGVSCTAAGSCAVVGNYLESSGQEQALILTQSGANWSAREASLPSDASSDTGAELESVSCSSAGNCTAVGRYNVFDFILDTYAPLLLTESGGTWGTATAGTLPNDANFSVVQSQPDLYVRSVSCVSPGNCTAVGSYDSTAATNQTPVAFTETAGNWATGVEITLPTPGLTTGPNYYQDAQLDSVDCLPAGGCVAAGTYDGTGGVPQALVASASGAGWSTASTAQGSGANSGVVEQGASVACSGSGYCLDGGYASASAAFDTYVPFLLQPADAVSTPSALLSGTQAAVSWSAPSDNGGLPVTGYSVTANDQTNSARGGQTVSSPGTSATITGLTASDSYSFTVTPQSLLGPGLPATSATVAAPASQGQGTGSSSNQSTGTANQSTGTSSSQSTINSNLAQLSSSQIKASLAGLLDPTGNNAKPKAITKHSGYTFTYRALEPGKIVIDWYRYTGKGKHRRKQLIASGKGTASSAQAISIKVKLNPLGKRLVKAGKKLQVSATASFTAAGTTSSNTRTFTLR